MDLKQKIRKLPISSGVYLFKNELGKIIYIGKATSLKNRVGSYFVGAHDTKTEKLISQVSNISIRKTDTVLEALILESNLIKKYQPKYNIQLKDDKSFSYFVITKEDFPKILIIRQTDLELKVKSYPPAGGLKDKYGPYTSKKQMLIALKIIRKIFPYHSLKQKSEKGCLDHQIGLCPGPYAGKITKQDYNKNIRGIKMILEGKKKGLIKKMEKEMKALAKKQEFEKAGDLRNKIFALNHIQDIALISKDNKLPVTNYQLSVTRVEAYDISNISGQFAVGSMVVFDGDEPNKKEYRKFKIKTVKEINDIAMMKEVLERRFKNDWQLPGLILLDGGVGHLNMAKKVFKEHDFKIPIIAVAKGVTRKKLDLQMINCKNSNDIKEIIGNKNLIGQIMDEAHRFAITYHRNLRNKNLLK